jgi:hypothetical protein
MVTLFKIKKKRAKALQQVDASDVDAVTPATPA